MNLGDFNCSSHW